MGHLKISTRLALGFAFMVLLIAALAAIGFERMQDLSERLRAVAEVDLQIERNITEWEKLTALNGLRTTVAGELTNPETVARLQKDMDAASARITQLQNAVQTALTDPEGKVLFAAIQDKRSAYRDARAAALKARAAGDAASATRFFQQDMAGYLDAYVGSVSALLAHDRTRMDQSVQESLTTNRTTRTIFAGGAAAAALIAILLAWFITRSITRPLRRAVALAERVAQRDLSAQFTISGRDEIARLLRALATMVGNLCEAITEVRNGANAIATASGQIHAGNEDLSSRTEEQASSLAQTAATMEQIAAAVRQSADNAQQADQLAETVSKTATAGGQAMAELVAAIQGIGTQAQEMERIVSVIDSIAFQTNILALNAAVEAARAGEQGRGFAVVAAEVRALAQRSAASAKEIKALIDTSVRETTRGTGQAATTGQTMQQVIESIRRLGDLMDEVSTASREQATGVEQVNTAVAQMDDVTRQNASLVEESTAAAASLHEQADALASLVATFRLPQAAGEAEKAHEVQKGIPVMRLSPSQATNGAQAAGAQESDPLPPDRPRPSDVPRRSDVPRLSDAQRLIPQQQTAA